MGTPCVIAMRNGEDSYRWIFSPYNGDIQSVGRMLFDGFVACKPGILMPGLHAMRVFC